MMLERERIRIKLLTINTKEINSVKNGASIKKALELRKIIRFAGTPPQILNEIDWGILISKNLEK